MNANSSQDSNRSGEREMTQKAASPSATSLAEAEDARLDGDVESKSQSRLILGRFLRHKPAMISAVILVVLIVFAVSSIGLGPIPGWWGYNFKDTADVVNGGQPSSTHWFGQDNVGRDYFALTMRGLQVSLMVAFLVGAIATIVGTIVGAFAGYYRGWFDAVLMRITDIFFVVPLLLIAAIVGAIASSAMNSPAFFGVMLGLVTWAPLARLVRAQVLSLREREYVDAARSMGAGTWRIITKHLIPNTIGTVLVNATLTIASAVLLESSLSFLGYGVKDPETSLGFLISQYQNSFTSRPWLFWWPGLLILVIALAVNFIGDGLNDAFDPRQGAPKRRRLSTMGKLKATELQDKANDREAAIERVAKNRHQADGSGTSPEGER